MTAQLEQGHRKLIFTDLVELVGFGWGLKKQVLKVTVLLEYFDLESDTIDNAAQLPWGL